MGQYTTYVANLDGWQVWKIEDSAGTLCTVAKSGITHTDPLQGPYGFHSSDPIIMIRDFGFSEGTSIQVTGRWGMSKSIEYRPEGDKFVDLTVRSLTSSPEEIQHLLSYDGRKVEVSVVTYEYDASFIGRSEQRAMIDFTGIRRAYAEVTFCNESSRKSESSLGQSTVSTRGLASAADQHHHLRHPADKPARIVISNQRQPDADMTAP